jgi:two-component system, NtrC family, sensor histidine kinase HydH
MDPRPSNPARLTWFSPWLIMGSVCLLAGILLVLAVKNIHREKEFMLRALLSQANVLMRSLEASNRTGMMGMGWGQRQLQLLMEETAQQADVVFLALVSSNGRVLAHSSPDRSGKILPASFPKTGQTVYRFSEEGKKIFEVTRAFQPWSRHRGGGEWDRWCAANQFESQRNLYIIVGLDPTPFEDAHQQDMNQTLLLFGIMFLVGAAGILSLVWAQNYRTARCSLQDIRAFTSTLLNQMPIGLIAIDPKGHIQKSNEAARIMMKRPGGIIGKIDDYPCLLPIASRLRREDTVVDQEIQCSLSHGESVPLLVNAATIRDGEQHIAGQVFLFTDMTNIKQLEERLRRSERLAGLGQLAAGVAHEIRNPLSSIKGFATILANRFREGDRSREVADVMVQEVERLNRVVTELLDYARPIELQKRSVSCREFIQDSIRLIEKDASHVGVKISLSVEPEDLHLEVDPDRFSQVLLNLYLNAIQAMDGGGTLEIGAFRKADHVVLRISDTGAGISAEHLPHVFDPYFTTKPQGVGLGLANVHKFVEAHGGTVKVTSQPGQGTSFILTCSC